MTREFKVGDEIIMTAKDGTLVHDKIIAIGTPYGEDTVETLGGWWFNQDGSHSYHPGLSIRHADEVSHKDDETMWRLTFIKDWQGIKSGTVFERVKVGNADWVYFNFNNNKYAVQSTSHFVKLEPIPYGGNGRTVDIVIIDDMIPTPQKQEWVKGQIPEDYEGSVIIRHEKDSQYIKSWDFPLQKDVIIKYTHYFLVPPPPAAEVEAYGYLEWDNRNVDKHTTPRQYENARHFYNLPATAENKGKYLYIESQLDGDEWENHPFMTLDQFISYWSKKLDDNKLPHMTFTAAALEALGVK